jgi:phage-related minor tail protein
MSKTTLAEALPDAIAKVSEWIGRQEAQAKEIDAISPGSGAGMMFMAKVVGVHRDVAVAAQQSGDVVAMIAAYQKIKPALELAELPDDPA